MKNQYVGDISDYEKYSILRALRSAAGLPLAVCWMLTKPDASLQGSRTTYLDQPDRYRAFDSQVFDALRTIVKGAAKTRNIHAIEKSGILSPATFFNDLLGDDINQRRSYFDEFWKRTEEIVKPSLVFFDPDIGLSCPSIRKGRQRSSMYLFDDELACAFTRGHSLVVFDHHKRVERVSYLTQTFKRIQLATGVTPFALWSSRASFIVISQEDHRQALGDAARKLVGCWQPTVTFGEDLDLHE